MAMLNNQMLLRLTNHKSRYQKNQVVPLNIFKPTKKNELNYWCPRKWVWIMIFHTWIYNIAMKISSTFQIWGPIKIFIGVFGETWVSHCVLETNSWRMDGILERAHLTRSKSLRTSLRVLNKSVLVGYDCNISGKIKIFCEFIYGIFMGNTLKY